MVEQTHACECHCDIVFIAAFDDEVVTFGTAERNACNGGKICFCFLGGERFGTGGEVFLPDTFCANVFFVLVDVTVDNVIAVRSAEAGEERQVEHFFVLTEMPCISLGTCKTCAMDSGLLTCADTDCLTVNGVAYGVGLGIFERNERDDKVAFCAFGEFFVVCYNIEFECSVRRYRTRYF